MITDHVIKFKMSNHGITPLEQVVQGSRVKQSSRTDTPGFLSTGNMARATESAVL